MIRGLLFTPGYLWALPLTLTGLLAPVLCGAALPKKLEGGALLCVALPGGLCEAFFRKTGAAAFTWGGVIVLASEGLLQNARLLDHEQRHFWQARILGPLMPLAYAAAALLAVADGGHWYRDNWFENDARKAAAEVPT